MCFRSKLEVILFVELFTGVLALEVEDNLKNGNCKGHCMNQCSKKSSYPAPTYSNLFWFLKILVEKTLECSDDNSKTNTSKEETDLMTHP